MARIARRGLGSFRHRLEYRLFLDLAQDLSLSPGDRRKYWGIAGRYRRAALEVEKRLVRQLECVAAGPKRGA